MEGLDLPTSFVQIVIFKPLIQWLELPVKTFQKQEVDSPECITFFFKLFTGSEFKTVFSTKAKSYIILPENGQPHRETEVQLGVRGKFFNPCGLLLTFDTLMSCFRNSITQKHVKGTCDFRRLF